MNIYTYIHTYVHTYVCTYIHVKYIKIVLPCERSTFPFLLLEKYHNKITTSNNKVIQRTTPIIHPTMIPTDEPSLLSLLLCASADPTTGIIALDVIGLDVILLIVIVIITVVVVIVLDDTAGVDLVLDTVGTIGISEFVAAMVDTGEVVGTDVMVLPSSAVEVNTLVLSVDIIEVVIVIVVASLVDTIEVVGVTVVTSLVDIIEVVGATAVVSLIDAVETISRKDIHTTD